MCYLAGDLFDEGKWCTEKEFDEYVERFYKLFRVPEGTAMYTVVGNHDIGFHYRYNILVFYILFDVLVLN